MSNLSKEFRVLLEKREEGLLSNGDVYIFLKSNLPKLLDELEDANKYIEDLKHNYEDAKRFWIRLSRYMKALEKCREQRNEYTISSIKSGQPWTVIAPMDKQIEQILDGEEASDEK